ncbi:MAG TPA: hypothetical protein DDX29_12150, partial [Clostridiales bacterium]|nr:hypothetical protein [Clostridiales bacterium]
FAFHSCGDGGRYAARHNAYNWNGTTGIAPVFDAHGNEGVGGNYASMGTEVSYNLITSTNNESIRIEDARGGKHLVNNNDAITTSGVDMTTKEEFSDDCNPTNNGSATSDGEPQHVSGTYFWGNTKNGSTPVNATIAIECSTTTCSVQNCLAENVDFFNTTYSYTPYTYPHPLRVHTTTYVPWVH